MKITALTFIIYALPTLGLPAGGNCATFKTLHQFEGGADGANSSAELLIEGNTLYGTTVNGGGIKDGGTIFSIDLDTGIEKIVHSFTGPLDGGHPKAGLLAWKGALYGATEFGGGYGSGEAFEFDPTTAKLTPLYTFGGGYDAANPQSNLVECRGKLYGTSVAGGDNDEGALFALDPQTGSEFVAFSFGSGSDGNYPVGELLKENNVLYGATSFVVSLFSIIPSQGSGTFRAPFKTSDAKS